MADYKFYTVEGELVRMRAGRLLPDLLGKTGWVRDHDLEAFEQRAIEIDEAQALKLAEGIDLYGPSIDRGDNADTDKQVFGLLDAEEDSSASSEGSTPAS